MSFTQTEVAHPLLSEGVIRLQNEMHDHVNTHPEIQEKFTKGLQEASEKVVHDVRGLSKSIREIQGAFCGISKALHKFDDETDLGESDGPSPLRQRWDGLHEEFDILLENSRKNAADAITVLDTYNNVLFPGGGPLDPTQYDSIKVEIQGLIEDVGNDGDKAAVIEKGFTALARKIRQFEDTVEDTVMTRGEAVAVLLQNTREELASLRVKLAAVKSEMTDIGLACVACLSAGAISAAFLFCALSPTAIQALVTSVLGAVIAAKEFRNKYKECNELKSSIEECKLRIAEEWQKDELLKQYHDELAKSKSDIEDLCLKIDSIAGIWYYLKSDFILLHSQLSKAAGPEKPMTRFFGAKIGRSRELYVKLQYLLEEYVRGVSVADEAVA
ncbi:uncharacterized protein TRAVEDRAFT_20250 [Trametes versicolor FP-101664 SS1]|uniref:uncharacterized protein n=1 Tax=Trametes versicolor (strain FP-101664) TaxID=717944 RepID=UPI0004622694|nr:uncharacterized protein TRAVEDRAFT_20250 [Trametes versicolor FP-101664 SS1]EIW58139.1 hypothetical protein TRAVEDRAFT_20250 [Trametes versicolor FP-101664 SS1]